jgi:hypothetical protein
MIRLTKFNILFSIFFKTVASDSHSNLRFTNFRPPIFRFVPISQHTSFERKIGNREFISKADELRFNTVLLLFAVKK